MPYLVINVPVRDANEYEDLLESLYDMAKANGFKLKEQFKGNTNMERAGIKLVVSDFIKAVADGSVTLK